MIPSDALRVTSQSKTELVVWDPPFYSFATWLFVLATLSAIVAVAAAIRGWLLPFLVMSSLLAVTFVFFGAYFWTSQSYITLSKDKGIMELMHYSFWKCWGGYDWKLPDVKEVIVENASFARYLTLVMKSGATSGLGKATNRDGYHLVANAMNDFLKSSPS